MRHDPSEPMQDTGGMHATFDRLLLRSSVVELYVSVGHHCPTRGFDPKACGIAGPWLIPVRPFQMSKSEVNVTGNKTVRQAFPMNSVLRDFRGRVGERRKARAEYQE